MFKGENFYFQCLIILSCIFDRLSLLSLIITTMPIFLRLAYFIRTIFK